MTERTARGTAGLVSENRVYTLWAVRSAATTMTNMNTSELIRVVDHAAAMDDRWLFLAVLCLLLLGCGAVIYWLVRQLQAVLAGHKAARDAHQVTLTQIIATQNETSLKLAVCLDRNTAALEDCTHELRRCREQV